MWPLVAWSVHRDCAPPALHHVLGPSAPRLHLALLPCMVRRGQVMPILHHLAILSHTQLCIIVMPLFEFLLWNIVLIKLLPRIMHRRTTLDHFFFLTTPICWDHLISMVFMSHIHFKPWLVIILLYMDLFIWHFSFSTYRPIFLTQLYIIEDDHLDSWKVYSSCSTCSYTHKED